MTKKIKTFYAVKPEDVDKEVNKFIEDKELFEFKFYHKDPFYYVIIIYEVIGVLIDET